LIYALRPLNIDAYGQLYVFLHYFLHFQVLFGNCMN